jgi:Leucine-rich repeat (LRR) protein
VLISQRCLLEDVKCKEENKIIDCSSIGPVLYQFPCADEVLNMNLSRITISNHKFSLIPSRIFTGLRVNTLDFSSNQIETIADDAFDSISNVIFTLRLSQNRIKVIKKKHFEKLVWLLKLYLDNNHIHLIEEGAFKSLIVLEILNLNYNNLSLFQDSHFKDLNNLFSLEIKGNSLGMKENKELVRMTSLTSLVINENQIESLSEIKLNGSKMFKILEIASNQIKSVRAEDFKTIRFISTLDLSFNQISEIENSSFVELKFLLFLRLTGNRIKTIDNLIINYLPLRAIELGFNQIEEINLEFKKFTKLKFLNLTSNGLRNIDFLDFSYHPEITVLDLSVNLIENITNHRFEALVKLEKINLSKNPIRYFKHISFNSSKIKEITVSASNMERETAEYLSSVKPQIVKELKALDLIYLNRIIIRDDDYALNCSTAFIFLAKNIVFNLESLGDIMMFFNLCSDFIL